MVLFPASTVSEVRRRCADLRSCAHTIANDGYPGLDDIIDRVGTPPDHQLSSACLVLGCNLNFGLATNVLGHEYAVVGADSLGDSVQPCQSKVPVVFVKVH